MESPYIQVKLDNTVSSNTNKEIESPDIQVDNIVSRDHPKDSLRLCTYWYLRLQQKLTNHHEGGGQGGVWTPSGYWGWSSNMASSGGRHTSPSTSSHPHPGLDGSSSHGPMAEHLRLFLSRGQRKTKKKTIRRGENYYRAWAYWAASLTSADGKPRWKMQVFCSSTKAGMLDLY